MQETYTRAEHAELYEEIIVLEKQLIHEREDLAKSPTEYNALRIQHTLQQIGVKRERIRHFMKMTPVEGGNVQSDLRSGD